MNKPIYLDNHATTPVDPRVLDAMLPYFKEEFGNASSATHSYGWNARAAVEKARSQVSKLIGSRPDEIIFTSGATESNNWALINGLSQGDHAVSTQIEHPSVLVCLEELKKKGVQHDLVAPDSEGKISVQSFEELINSNTKIVSAMFANNEIGSILPVKEISELAKKHGLLFHCDAVQATGRLLINVNELQVDFLSLSAHKVYGPKGIGALFVRRETREKFSAAIVGGGQERGLRAGTLNVPGIVGFGTACEIALLEQNEESKRIVSLRDSLWLKLKQSIPRIRLNGSMQERLSGNLNFCIEGIDGEGLLLAVQNQIAISASSACCSSGPKGSRVLRALGLSADDIQSSFRIGIGRFNTLEDIEIAARALCLAQAGSEC